MIRIDNEKELLSFLKILSEEAVSSSVDLLRETSDNLADTFKSRLASEKDLYEQEGDDEDAEDLAAALADETQDDADQSLQAPDQEDTAEVEEEQEEPEEPQPTKPEADAEPEELKASLDALERFINALRAGRSLRDSSVEDQVELYFDRLGDDEKSLMVLFIRELSRILSGEVSGDDAINPNDEPYNLDVITDEEEPSPSQPTDEPAQSSSPPPSEEAEELEEEEPEEDTSPPIRVGEPQNLAEIRKKVRKLMRS